MPHFNYLAILAAVIIPMVLGWLWYGPLFGKLWMQGMGWDPNNQELMAQRKGAMKNSMTGMLVGSIIMAFVLAYVVWAFSAAGPGKSALVIGLWSGFAIWFGFVLPIKWGDNLWGGKAIKYVSIDLLYYLVLFLINGLVLAHWK